MVMPVYAIDITPLLSWIKEEGESVKHAAFADDLGGSLDNIVNYDPLLGYYPKASKSSLVVKEPYSKEAEGVFVGTDSNKEILRWFYWRKYITGKLRS